MTSKNPPKPPAGQKNPPDPPPPAQPPSPPPNPTSDPSLQAAWESLARYDSTALYLKNQHVNNRALVLLLSFGASLLSVSLGFAPFGSNFQFQHLYLVLPLILPLILTLLAIRLSNTNDKKQRTGAITLLTILVSLILGGIGVYQFTNISYQTTFITFLVVSPIILSITAVWVTRNYDTPTARRNLLILSVAVGIVLVGMGIWESPNLYRNIYEVLRFTLFALPLTSAGIIAYATRYIPSQLWAQYRFAGEAVRRHIFRYQMQAGIYAETDLTKRRKSLIANVQAIEKETLLNEEPPKFNLEIVKEEMKKQTLIEGATPADRLQCYIKCRLENQVTWYRNKSIGEYRAMGRWQIVALVIGGAGSVLAYLGLEAWVAVTTAAAVTVAALADLQMYGRTYMIYLMTAQDLHHYQQMWENDTEEDQNNSQNIASFVDKIEERFEAEIADWRKQVQDALSDIDKNIPPIVDKAPATPDGKLLKEFNPPWKPKEKQDSQTPPAKQ